MRMRNSKKFFLISVFFYLFSSTSLLWTQSSIKDKELEEIIQEATLNLYMDPISVIQVGDSLIHNASDKVNEKATGLLLISDAFIAIRNYPQALHYMNTAKELIDHHQLTTGLKIKILNRFAYQHFQLNLFDEALVYLKNAEQLNDTEKNAIAYYTNKGYTNVVKGLIYRNLVGCSVAMKYFDKSIENYSKSDEDLAKMNTSVIHYNIGNCYTAMGEFEKAKQSYELSFHFADIDSNTKNSLKLFAKKGIANYHYAIGQYEIAIDTLETLIKDASKIGDKTLMRSIYSDLATNYLAMGNWSLYEKYFNEYKKNNNEIKDAEINATLFVLTDIQNSHENFLSLKSKKFNLQIVGIIIFSLVILILYSLFILKKHKQIKQIKLDIFKKE